MHMHRYIYIYIYTYALDSLDLSAIGLKPTGIEGFGVNTGASGVNSARFVVASANAVCNDR